jgi:hypothetical protein
MAKSQGKPSITIPRPTGSTRNSKKCGQPTSSANENENDQRNQSCNPATPLTRSGKPRRGNKATITEARLRMRHQGWDRVKHLLRSYLRDSPQGEQRRMAQTIGIADSQLHRFSCETCEHDQEPSFTIGLAILLYISQSRFVFLVTEIPTHPQYNESNRKTKTPNTPSNA